MTPFDEWQPLAACKGKPLAWWFPENTGHWGIYDAARQVCRHCPVTEPCLAYAVTNQLNHGMYGGLTPDERHQLQPPPANCGTPAGYKRHRRDNTFPCDPCTAAHAHACRQARLNREQLSAAAAQLMEGMR